MSTNRRKYNREFKVEAVRMVLEGERTLTQVAQNLGINRNMLARWRDELRKDVQEAFRGQGKKTAQDEELSRLRRELNQTKQERDILKKALAYFAEESK